MIHLKTFSLFESTEEVQQLSAALEKYKKQMSLTNDLFKIDQMVMMLENDNELEHNDYNIFHRKLVPEWVNKHWMKDMTYRNINLEKILYKEFEPVFSEFLESKNFSNQECFVAYEYGSNEEYESDNGKFVMGFDIFEKGEDIHDSDKLTNLDDKTGILDIKKKESGWACFCFKTATYPESIIKFKKFDDSKTFDIGSGSGSNYPIECVYELGQGTFYSYKTKGPYKNLADYFGDGCVILRED